MKIIHVVVVIHNNNWGQEKQHLKQKPHRVTIWENTRVLSIHAIVNGLDDV